MTTPTASARGKSTDQFPAQLVQLSSAECAALLSHNTRLQSLVDVLRFNRMFGDLSVVGECLSDTTLSSNSRLPLPLNEFFFDSCTFLSANMKHVRIGDILRSQFKTCRLDDVKKFNRHSAARTHAEQ